MIEDFPKKGVSFRDISPLLADSEQMKEAIFWMTKLNASPDYYIGLDARGFIFAGAMTLLTCNAGVLMCRKQGKLPGNCVKEKYSLEYREDVLELQKDVVEEGARVIIVDDVLATGGSALCAANLCKKAGLEVVGITVLMELSELGGRTVLEKEGYKVESLLKY